METLFYLNPGRRVNVILEFFDQGYLKAAKSDARENKQCGEPPYQIARAFAAVGTARATPCAPDLGAPVLIANY